MSKAAANCEYVNISIYIKTATFKTTNPSFIRKIRDIESIFFSGNHECAEKGASVRKHEIAAHLRKRNQ